MAEIRFVSKDDCKEAAALADFVFRDKEQSSMAVAFPSIFSGSYESSIGVYEEDKLVAFAGLVPSVLQIGPSRVPIFSLGAVCTHPDFRGRGYAGAMQNEAFSHIEKSGGTMLLVSGELDIYLRNGCRRFGAMREYSLKPETAARIEHKSSNRKLIVREARESDWFMLNELDEANPVRYRRSMYELATLTRAEAIASIYKLKHRIYVAEEAGTAIAFAIVAVKAQWETGSQPRVIEWAGEAEAAALILACAVRENSLSELGLFVPWQEKALQSALEPASYEPTTNSGTVKIVNPMRLWERLQPYLFERNKELASRISLADANTGEEGAVELTVDGIAYSLHADELTTLLFDPEPQLPAELAGNSIVQALFPCLCHTHRVFISSEKERLRMIFDCHTHLFGPGHFGGPTLAAAKRAWGEHTEMLALPEQHEENIKDIDGAIVLAFDGPATGMNVPNEYVADYVSKKPGRLFGFASVDPNRDNAAGILEAAIKEYGLSGLKLGPIYQNFYPDSKEHYELYAKADELKLPILWHQGTSFVPEGYLDASRPAMLDPIARAFPNLKMIIAHMGHPWTDECIAVVRKNPAMFMDISALGTRPWQFYNAMVLAVEYGVTHKILFGSDYPFFTTAQTIERFRAINDLTEGTKLPRIPEQVIEDIIHRNTPDLLGLK
ncbi:GNAT family N-acetyltransferase [Cohnella faecalis]|nr:GNAT family N-acetyltransferase [Cohnella faecalis]